MTPRVPVLRRLPLLLVLLSACAPSGCARRAATVAAQDGGDGGPTPLTFTLPRFPEGAPFDVASRRGSVLLIDVWATWCDPCIDALPAYEKLLAELGPAGLEVYAISIDQDPRQIARFLETSKLTLPVLHDQDAAVAERTLRIQMVPTTLLVDRKGHIRHRHEGFNESTLADLRRKLEPLLAEEKTDGR